MASLRPEFHLLAVVHHDLHPTRDVVAEVSGLAAVGLRDRPLTIHVWKQRRSARAGSRKRRLVGRAWRESSADMAHRLHLVPP
jgi:hypothetical protein